MLRVSSISAVRLGPVTSTMALERVASSGSRVKSSAKPETMREAGTRQALAGGSKGSVAPFTFSGEQD